MNKQEFMLILNDELVKNKVNDREDIIADFNEHFICKLEEGKTEEEVIQKIGNPVEIASDYKNYESDSIKDQNKIIKIGLYFSDSFTYFTLFMVWLCIFVLGLMSISFFVMSGLLITTLNISDLIPSMPYISSLLFGLSVLGLAVLTLIGTIFLVLYANHWHKTYRRWRKNAINGHIFPSMSIHPNPSKRFTTKLKLLNIFSAVVFLAMFTVGFVVSTIIAESIEFWHVWEWFV